MGRFGDTGYVRSAVSDKRLTGRLRTGAGILTTSAFSLVHSKPVSVPIAVLVSDLIPAERWYTIAVGSFDRRSPDTLARLAGTFTTEIRRSRGPLKAAARAG